MLTWIKKKYYENKVMLTFYKTTATLLDEQKDIISLLVRLYATLKDTPTEDLKSALITKLAEIIHESARQEHGGEEV